MKFEFLKTPSFYFGGILVLGPTILALVLLDLSSIRKVLISIFFLVIYSFNQLFLYKKTSERIKGKLVGGILKSVDLFKSFDQNQRLRSNIFFLKKRKGIYYIKYSHNMSAYGDKNIEIRENMGCTGEAWRTKRQIFGDQNKIYQNGKYRIEDVQLKKVPKDLRWICATPILNDNRDVIAVLNFDGDKDLTPDQITEIKRHCQRLSEELKEIFTKF